MKTAVSLPDNVYIEAEKLADRLGTSRSQLYAQALASYVAMHNREDVTERLNQIYSAETSTLEKGLSDLQTASLPREEW